jgi:hypothetical protein
MVGLVLSVSVVDWFDVLVGVNDGLAVVGSEVGCPSCTVWFWVGFTRERKKSQITNMIKIVVLFDTNYVEERLKMQMFPAT